MLITDNQQINIAVVANWKYVIPMETTIKSIAFHNRNFTIYVINPDIPHEWFLRMNERLAPLSSQLVDTKISTDRLENQHISQPHINLMANARLLIPDLLDCDRVLYLDCDIIVRKSLLNLYNTDFQGRALAAIQEADGERFNSGVMLMNLVKMRQQENLVSQLLKYGETPDLENGDESVMNHFFFDDHLALPVVYNMQVGLEKPWQIALEAHRPGAAENLQHQRDLMKQIPNAVIIHYLTSVKPWATISYSRCRNLWWQYYRMQWPAVVNRELPTLEKNDGNVLIWTDTDDMPQLVSLLKAMPNTVFTVCSNGSVSNYLQNLISYPNLRLFPGVLDHYLNHFISHCQVYLDLNAGSKNVDLLQQLVDRYCPIYSFQGVATEQLIPYSNYHLFQDDQISEFTKQLTTLLNNN